jgi:hypothetical protein
MNLNGSYDFNAPVEKVWNRLMDADAVGSCLPNCRGLRPAGEDRYDVELGVAVAAISGSFKGSVALEDKIPPRSYKLVARATMDRFYACLASRVNGRWSPASLTRCFAKYLPGRCLVLGGIGREVAVFREVNFLQQLVEAPARFLAGRHLFPQVVEKRALGTQRIGCAEIAVAGHHRAHVPRGEFVQYLHPVEMIGVAVADIIPESPVHAQIAGEQNPLPRQKCHRVADSVRGVPADVNACARVPSRSARAAPRRYL